MFIICPNYELFKHFFDNGAFLVLLICIRHDMIYLGLTNIVFCGFYVAFSTPIQIEARTSVGFGSASSQYTLSIDGMYIFNLFIDDNSVFSPPAGQPTCPLPCPTCPTCPMTTCPTCPTCPPPACPTHDLGMCCKLHYFDVFLCL